VRIYVVAISQKEAEEIARDLPEVTHTSQASALQHLAQVKAPPTDPYYAAQYRIYAIDMRKK
jgi:DNA repair ATPase RecN